MRYQKGRGYGESADRGRSEATSTSSSRKLLHNSSLRNLRSSLCVQQMFSKKPVRNCTLLTPPSQRALCYWLRWSQRQSAMCERRLGDRLVTAAPEALLTSEYRWAITNYIISIINPPPPPLRNGIWLDRAKYLIYCDASVYFSVSLA